MRKVSLPSGREIEVRPMTRAELRAGKKFGLGSASYAVKPDSFDETIDYVCGPQIDAQDLETIPNPDLLKLYEAIIAETYGHKGEEKNLPMSGPGAQTENVPPDAKNAENGTK